MSLLGALFGSKNTPAKIARDRLKIVLSHERADNSFPFLEQMRNDILAVVKKYTAVRDVRITSQKNQNIDRLEIEVELGA
jgi:cell division topological specificity factor